MPKGLKIIDAMNALGYKADARGVCYGIEYMAIQAAVRGKFDQFKTRMDCIHSYENSDSFLTDWNNALTLKKPDTDNHNSKKSLDVDKLVNDIDVILDDKDENNSDIELNNLIDHLEQNYNSPVEPEVLRSMRSFFEGVEIYMQGELYPEFFDAIKVLTPKGQDFRASSMLASDNPKEMEPFDKLKVAHNKASLVQYLNDLCALKNDAIEGMSIGLNTYGHAMALVRNKGQWVLVNHDEITEFKDNGACAEAIISRFSANENAVFSMTLHHHNAGKVQEITQLNEKQVERQLEMCKLVDSKGVNLLSLATAKQDFALLSSLINKGANLNIANESPLLIAVQMGSFSLVQGLLNSGASTELKGQENTPILAAIENANVPIIELLVKHKVNLNEPSSSFEIPPLVKAIKLKDKNPEIVALVIKLGADPCRRYDDGDSALDILLWNFKKHEDHSVDDSILYELTKNSPNVKETLIEASKHFFKEVNNEEDENEIDNHGFENESKFVEYFLQRIELAKKHQTLLKPNAQLQTFKDYSIAHDQNTLKDELSKLKAKESNTDDRDSIHPI